MRVYSQLERASLENLAADPSQGTRGRIWVLTTSGKVRYDDGTNIRNLGGVSGSSFRWFVADNAPIEENLSGLELLDFDSSSSQSIYGMIKVADEYTAGTQILLRGGLFACSSTSGDVLFTATASLIEPASTVLDTYSNQHTSTNATVSVPGAASTITAIGDVDITDASGEINSVAVAAGDLILVQFQRNNSGETSSAANDARLLRNSFEVIQS